MAWWGKALAFGPNINDFGYQRPSEAFPSASKATELKGSVSPVEKALIEAMAIRYKDDSTADQNKLNVLYKDENTGAIQVTIDPNNPNIIYADLWADAELERLGRAIAELQAEITRRHCSCK